MIIQIDDLRGKEFEVICSKKKVNKSIRNSKYITIYFE